MKIDKRIYTLSYILRTLGLGIFTTLFNIFILECTSLSSEFLAKFLTIGNISMAISSYFIGILIDKYEKKILVIFFTIVCALCFTIEILVHNELLLYIVSVLYGIGATGLFTLNAPLLKSYEKSTNNNLIIIYRAINIMAVTIGAVLAGFLTGNIYNISTQVVLLMVPVLYLLAALIFLFHSSALRKDEIENECDQKPMQVEKKSPKNIFIMATIVFLFLGFAPLLSNYINVDFKERFALSISNVAYIYALINFLSGVVILICSKINFRRKGNVFFLLVAIIIDNLILIFCPVVLVQIVGVFIYLSLYEIIISITYDFILTVGDEQYHGRLSGMIQAASNLSESLGIYICGILIGVKLPNIIFVLSISSTLIGAMTIGLMGKEGQLRKWKNK